MVALYSAVDIFRLIMIMKRLKYPLTGRFIIEPNNFQQINFQGQRFVLENFVVFSWS